MIPDFDKILYEGHPANGTDRAAYQFLIFDPSTGTPVRFLLVEAEDPWAVATLEKILLWDGKVNDTCRIIAIFRDHRVAGVRDDLIEEVPYTDFMLDIVDPERLMARDASGNQVALACFVNSLPRAARDRVLRRLQEMRSVPRAALPAPAPVYTAAQETPSENAELLTSVLCDMGFKKSDVKKFVQSLGPRVELEPVEALLREGIKSLTEA